MLKFILFFICILSFHPMTAFSKKSQDFVVTDYFPVSFPVFSSDDQLYIAMRSYKLNNEPHFLLVDPHTFLTHQQASNDLHYRASSKSGNGYIEAKEIMATPYYQALQRYTMPPYQMQNYGLKHAHHPVDGVFLTIDMCPSYRPFEKNFYESLAKFGHDQQKPLPIAVSITSLWAFQHQQEFDWLTEQQWLDITWVNHSLSHAYYPDVDLNDNFLNFPGTNIIEEVLSPEKMLISKGLTPSVFFRFPGLIASEKLIKLIHAYGLIPLGADAWLAKEEKPRVGSIILVHGNANEPEGIELFMKWFQGEKLPFLPLQKAITPGIEHEASLIKPH